MTSHSVRIGIIGVGNCARALLEGISYYRARPDRRAGLMHQMIGPYSAGSVTPVAAWDVDSEKVGKDLWSARTAGQNLDVGIRHNELPVATDVTVSSAPVFDGVGERYGERIAVSNDLPDETSDAVLDQIHHADVHVLLNYLPVGSQRATEWWAETALRAGVSFVNNVPVFIARHERWRARFRKARLPLMGDDIKSQLGATYLHRTLVRAFSDRGILLERTYQLNAGGNMDFYNMLERHRLGSKRESKTHAVIDAYDSEISSENVHIGPSDFVAFLGDTKKAFIRCEGRGFGDAPMNLEMQLTVPDSPNSAGVVIDAARIAKLAMDRSDVTADEWASAWLFKAPPLVVREASDHVARERLDQWLSADPGPTVAES